MFDYKLLEAFARVVQEGGFERAGRSLGLTQSAVSQRVRLLEDQTGQVLLTRGAPPVPTAFGRRLLAHHRQVRHLEENLRERQTDTPETIALGVNADSLATWFLPALSPFLAEHPVLLDLKVADQEQTHRLLRDGEVLGCVSARDKAVQGCRMTALGTMQYRLVSSPAFARRWFPGGLSAETLRRAPTINYSRDDTLNEQMFRRLGDTAPAPPAHCIPSVESFLDFIRAGHACGMVPELQCAPLLQDGPLTDLAPGHHLEVHLFWHCWNLASPLLEALTRVLSGEAAETVK